jgi:PAS domain S-box-containing protein
MKPLADNLENNTDGSLRAAVLNGVLFGIAGYILNWFKLELFFNVDFLFGSIITMFALMRFGLVTGVIAALIAASCTLHHWHQPWAIVIFTAEALCTGLLCRRRKCDVVVANLAYWFSGGLLLVMLFYQGVMGFSFASTLLIALKQGINGITNTLAASALYIGYCYQNRRQGKSPSLRQFIFVAISLFVIIPAFFLMYSNVRRTLALQLDMHKGKTQWVAKTAEKGVSLWLKRSRGVINYLAETNASPDAAARLSRQHNLDAMRSAMPEFKRLGIVDERAVTTAFSPAIDETGASTIGLDFSDRPYIAAVKAAPHPMITQLISGKVGNPGPRLTLVAPMLAAARYRGAAFGVAELDSLKQALQNMVQAHDMDVTLVDDKGRVVISTSSSVKSLDEFALPKNGAAQPLGGGLSHWIPDLQPGSSAAKRWMASFYLAELPLESNPGWKVVVEAPLKPELLAIGRQTSQSLASIGVLLLLLIYFSRLIAVKITAIISEFEQVTRQLPVRIAAGEPIEWPTPLTVEIQGLIDNVRLMGEAMRHSYEDLAQLNENLERRVAVRTGQFADVMQELGIILENVPVGISKMVDRKQIWVNRKMEELFLYSKMELEQQSIRKLYPSDDAFEKLGRTTYPLLAMGQVVESVQELVRKDGVHIPVRYIGMAIDPADLSKGTIWLMEDITARRQAEQKILDSNLQLREARDQAESANRAKSEFLANMSHEIRTPMNGVIGMAQLLALTELNEEQQVYVDALKLSGNNLLSLINDILDLSKIEARKIKIELADFSLQHCINNVVVTQKSAIYEKGLSLDVIIGSDVPHVVVGDELRVKQILLNLLGNAVKFTEQGGITIEARLLEHHDRSVLIQLEVCDTGIGIADEAFERIFMPFVQEDGTTTRKFGGTGLGLTISQRMAELMGGGITVASTPGSGSRFTVTLPFSVARNNATAAVPASDGGGDVDSPALRILLVEDNAINMMFAISLLKKLGHEVVTEDNGIACLAALAKGSFDLVLMDIQMPVMTGDDALREIRRLEEGTGRHQPVIALTAYALRGEKDRFLKAGFDGYVSKPLVIGELVGEMKQVLGQTASGVAAAEDNQGGKPDGN